MDKIKQIISKTKCLVLDMDGTIYLDSTPIGDMINTLKIRAQKNTKAPIFNKTSTFCFYFFSSVVY